RAHITNGGYTGFQCYFGVVRPIERLLRGKSKYVLVKVQIPVRTGFVAKVNVSVDEPRQQCDIPEVDNLGVGGNFCVASQSLNLLSNDDNYTMVFQFAGHGIEKMSSLEHYGFWCAFSALCMDR